MITGVISIVHNNFLLRHNFTVRQATLVYYSYQGNFMEIYSNIFILNNTYITAKENFAKCLICIFSICFCALLLLKTLARV